MRRRRRSGKDQLIRHVADPSAAGPNPDRSARDEGRRTQEKLARARHDYLRDLSARMRAALRLIVDGPVRKVQMDQLALFDEDEAGSSR